VSRHPARPVRLRLSRAKGFNLQDHSRSVNGLLAVNCARPSKWGNPFVIGLHRKYGRKSALGYRDAPNAAVAVKSFRAMQEIFGPRADIGELRGKNLACWCQLTAPCHCDVLLELANRPTCEAVE
jgi:hypothetical protein